MKVLVINPNDLDEKLQNNKRNSFVRFHSPYCGHCRAMEDDWREFAERAPNDMDVIDVDVSNGIDGSNHDISKMLIKAGGGVPRMYLIKDNKIAEYNGERNADKILLFAKQQLGGKRRYRKTRRYKNNNRKNYKKTFKHKKSYKNKNSIKKRKNLFWFF